MVRKHAGRWIDRAGGLSLATCTERRLLEDRYAAMIELIPGLYLVLLVNLGGLLLVVGRSSFANPIAIILPAAIFARFISWSSKRGWHPRGRTALREMRRMVVNSALLSILHTLLIFDLYDRGHHGSSILLLGLVSALGAHFAMGVFPGSSRLPLIFLGVPVAMRLLLSGALLEQIMGLSLLTLMAISTRITAAIARTFADQVSARFQATRERRRAEQAERRALTERSAARRQSLRDCLTGLANRRALVDALAAALAQQPERVTLLLIDLDGFKPVNDTFGHKVGDELLLRVARRLRQASGRSAMVARLGGDEFAVLVTHRKGERDCPQHFAERLVGTLGRPYPFADRTIAVTACCGHALGREGSDPSQLMREADLALYAAKKRGHRTAAGFTPELREEVERRTALECALRMPGVEQEIELAFQPIVSLADGRIDCFEALARWRHSQLGPIPPSEFIPISEQILVIDRVSEALLVEASRVAARWPAPTRLSFNLSAVQLCTLGEADRLVELARGAGLDPRRLQIEVTETAVMHDFDHARANLAALRAAGVGVVLDDFGAGFASMSYLKEMIFDAVKLDGALVEAAAGGGRAAALLRGVIDLCRGMGMPCIAEHVGSEEEARLLVEMGCAFGQGFYLGRPVDAATAAAYARCLHPSPLRGAA